MNVSKKFTSRALYNLVKNGGSLRSELGFRIAPELFRHFEGEFVTIFEPDDAPDRLHGEDRLIVRIDIDKLLESDGVKQLVGKTKAKVILDSINSRGVRLTTVEIEYPTIIQAQLNTHKALSKNSASQRAIPSERWLYQTPAFVPNMVALAQKGMGETTFLKGDDLDIFRKQWLEWESLNVAKFEEIQSFWKARIGKGISKGLMNRPLAAFRYTRTVLTGVGDVKGWKNFERLRCDVEAQGEHQLLANAIRHVIGASSPVERTFHLPYAPEGMPLPRRITWSCSQCARVSYRRENTDNEKADLRIFEGLADKGHWSTFEHQGIDWAASDDRVETLFDILDHANVPSVQWEGNFYGSGWAMLRKLYDSNTVEPDKDSYIIFSQMNQWIRELMK